MRNIRLNNIVLFFAQSLLTLLLSGCPSFNPPASTGISSPAEFSGLESATAVSQSKIYLSWSPSSTSGVTYNVYQSRDLTTKITSTLDTHYQVTGLSSSTTYSFIVRAETASGVEDNNKVTKTATTLSYTVPDFNGLVRVSQITTSILGMTQLQLSWSQAGGSVTGYQVFMGLSEDSVDLDNPVAAVSAITSNPMVGPYLSGLSTATVDNLSPGVTYFFIVRAFYWDGSAKYIELNSITKSGTTLSSPPSASPPRVTSISPTIGLPAGGTYVTVSGMYFQNGAIVRVGEANCTSVTIQNSTTANCYTPAGSIGTTSITVINPDSQSGQLASGFTYQSAPTVTSVSPSAGTPLGGTSVVITGTNFVGLTTITMDGLVCTGLQMLAPTQVICNTPPHSVGPVAVTATNPDTSFGSTASAYTYQQGPLVTSITPKYGAATGGTSVTLTGSYFASGMTATIGGIPCLLLSVVSATSATCTTAAGPAGLADVTVKGSDGQRNTLTRGYSYTTASSPTISSISPRAGQLSGGNRVTITGTNFLPSATVALGTAVCSSVTVVSSTTITCVTGSSSAGTVNVIVTNSDYQTASLTNGWEYTLVPAPILTSVSPSGGPISGGSIITLSGQYFEPGTTVSIGGQACTPVSFGSAMSITCTTPAHASEVVDLIVTNTDSQSSTLTAAYSYQGAPTIGGFLPNAGSPNGGTTLTITGARFLPGASITMGGQACLSVNVVSASQITCVTPSGPVGTVSIVVTNPDGQFGNSATSYTYQLGPTLYSSAPSLGSSGATLTVLGSNILNGAQVSVGGIICSTSTWVSSNKIRCMVPVLTVGLKDLMVTNPDGQTFTLTKALYYGTSEPWTQTELFSGSLSPVGFTDASGSVAMYNRPGGVAVDPSRTYIYIADTYNYTIRRLEIATGLVTTIAGVAGSSGCTDGVGDAARFALPTDLTLVGDILYITDPLCQTVRALNILNSSVDPFVGSNQVFGDDDGVGNSSKFKGPRGITHDGTYLYVADSENHKIRRINISSGLVDTLGGNGSIGAIDGGKTVSQFNNPQSVAVVGTALYVADTDNNTIRRIDISASPFNTTTVAGAVGDRDMVDGIGVASRFYNPSGITYDGTFLYIVDNYASNIRKMDPSSNMVSQFAGGMTNGSIDGVGGGARFFNPYHITYDGSGYLYVADTLNNNIRRIATSSKTVSTASGPSGTFGYVSGNASTSRYRGIYGITSDNNYIYVTDTGNNVIRAISILDGSTSILAGTPNTAGATVDGTGASVRFYDPRRITTDGTYLYITQYLDHTIRKTEISSGNTITLAGQSNAPGSTDGFGTSARFNKPLGITYDNSNLYITDTLNCTIRKIVISSGTVSTIAGTAGICGISDGTAGAARFQNPGDIVTDGTNLFVADTGNCAIRKIVIATGQVSTLAGSAGTCSSPIDGVGPSALFGSIAGITTDGLYLYVSEYNHNSIRRINIGNGSVNTLAGKNIELPKKDFDGNFNASYFDNPNALTIVQGNLYITNAYGVRRLR